MSKDRAVPLIKKSLIVLHSIDYLSINSFLDFIQNLKGKELPFDIDILDERNLKEVDDSKIERMIRNAKNRNLLSKGKETKIYTGQTLKEICDKHNLDNILKLLPKNYNQQIIYLSDIEHLLRKQHS